ncbi:MAG: hypothetical protein R3181_01135 [Rubricoccaceae bacterium]|nr:hypothetical protein [Rubricoccaceae bacterium]
MTRRAPGTWLLLAAGAVVVAAVVAGLLTVGGAGEARLERLDRERLADLDRIERALARDRTRPLPPSLDRDALALSEADLTDPATGEPYGYRPLSDSTYELCATFALPSTALGPRDPHAPVGAYAAGPHCYVVEPERP